MRYHIIAFLTGFLLDLILGDPYYLPHPVRLIGKLIIGVEKRLHRKKGDTGRTEIWQGIGLVMIVLITVVIVTSFLLLAAYELHPYIGVILECLMSYQILAAKCLKVESMKVYQCLKANQLKQARTTVSMIVGRDIEYLDEEGVAKAAIETVAENTSDGVIAPMLYLAIGGPVFGFFYKAINTMDSMVGYKNDKYYDFGKCAAKLDDILNFIPARVSAACMAAASFFCRLDWKNAVRIFKRDRYCHASPNSGQTEAVCAGALNIQLAGDAYYFGKLCHKPVIGDNKRKPVAEDIRLAIRLLYGTAILAWGIGILFFLR